MEMVSNYILKLNNKYNSNYVFCELPNELKIKPEKCKECSYFNTCDGVWKAYLEQFGDEEIKPIKEELVEDGSR